MVKLLKSKTTLIIIAIISLSVLFIIQKKDVIFQEDNPLSMAAAMSEIVLQQNEIAEINGAEGVYGYLVKRGKMDPYIEMMEEDGWRFIERDEISNALRFEKGDTVKSVAYQYYTRWYTIIYS